jgi:hypothetical protein
MDRNDVMELTLAVTGLAPLLVLLGYIVYTFVTTV